MRMILDSNYFNYIISENINDYKYVAYIPKGHPMILYSLIDGSPLACLHTNSLITELNESNLERQQFQAIYKENNQYINFTMTNLCDDGYIDFNIMKVDEKVTEIEPKNRINNVNEVKPYQSDTFESDFTEDDKRMKVTKNNITLEQEINNEKKIGTYLYLSIVPQVDKKEMCDKFKETIWKPSDYFVISYKEKSGFNFGSNNQSGFSFGSSNQQFGFGSNNNQNSFSSNNQNNVSFSFGSSNQQFGFSGSNQNSFSFGGSNYQSKSNYETSHKDLYKSNVAVLTYGDKVKVNIYQTGVEYNYNLHSRSCVLGLSVMEDLKIADRDIIYVKNNITKILEDIKSNASKNLLKNIQKIYSSNECCICFESTPNQIFYKCGHKCIHKECYININKCPLCREIVYYKIDI